MEIAWLSQHLKRLDEILITELITRYWILQLCQALTEEDVCKTFKTSKQHDKDAEKIEGKES